MCRCSTGIYRSTLNLEIVQLFLTELSILNLEKKWNFQFLFIIYATVAYLQFRIGIWIQHRIMQVKFKFYYDPITFQSVTCILLYEIFSFHSQTHVEIFGHISQKNNTSNSNLVLVWWFLTVVPLERRKCYSLDLTL
jgi:hypothetical protein